MNVKTEKNKFKVECQYNTVFVKKARELQGKWEKPYWVFPDDNEYLVRKVLMDIYGEDGTPCERVTVDLNLDEYNYKNSVKVGDVVVANRMDRDAPVTLVPYAVVNAGEFCNRGGSRATPCVTHEKGTILRLKNIPKNLYEKVKNEKGLVLVEENNYEKRKKLEREREDIKIRLGKIEEELRKLP